MVLSNVLTFSYELKLDPTPVSTGVYNIISTNNFTTLRDAISLVNIELQAVTHLETIGAYRAVYLDAVSPNYVNSEADVNDPTTEANVSTVLLGTFSDNTVTSVVRSIDISTFTTLVDKIITIKNFAGAPVNLLSPATTSLYVNFTPVGNFANNNIVQ
jgi:hypothetical protein